MISDFPVNYTHMQTHALPYNFTGFVEWHCHLYPKLEEKKLEGEKHLSLVYFINNFIERFTPHRVALDVQFRSLQRIHSCVATSPC